MALTAWLRKNVLDTKIPYLAAVAMEHARWDYTYKQYRNKYTIDPSFYFNGNGTSLYGEGQIILGKNSYIGAHSIIESFKNCTIKVGDNCMISPHVSLRTLSMDLSDWSPKLGDITIGNDVWIGTGAFINPNVTIGDKAVIGANSVVTRNVPPNVLACGCPAIVKKKIRT